MTATPQRTGPVSIAVRAPGLTPIKRLRLSLAPLAVASRQSANRFSLCRLPVGFEIPSRRKCFLEFI
jgi:hypothetical protein